MWKRRGQIAVSQRPVCVSLSDRWATKWIDIRNECKWWHKWRKWWTRKRNEKKKNSLDTRKQKHKKQQKSKVRNTIQKWKCNKITNQGNRVALRYFYSLQAKHFGCVMFATQILCVGQNAMTFGSFCLMRGWSGISSSGPRFTRPLGALFIWIWAKALHSCGASGLRNSKNDSSPPGKQ